MAFAGSLFYAEIETSPGTWERIPGERRISTSVSSESVDTSAKSEQWRNLSPVGIRSNGINIGGVTRDDLSKALTNLLFSAAWSGNPVTIRIRDDNQCCDNLTKGTYFVTATERIGEYNNAEGYDFQLVSSGVVGDGLAPVYEFGTFDISQYNTFPIDRLQPYDADWGRRFYNELTGGRSFIAAGDGGAYAAYQINNVDPALRKLSFVAETSASGTCFAGAMYGLGCHDLDTTHSIDTEAILEDVVADQNFAWEKVRVKVENIGGTVAPMRIEIKDTTDTIIFWSPFVEVPAVNDWIEWYIPPLTNCKRMFVYINSPPTNGIASVEVHGLEAVVRIKHQMKQKLSFDVASLFAGGTGGVFESSLAYDANPALELVTFKAETGAGGTCFAGAEWTGVDITGWTGVRILMRVFTPGGRMRVELKDSGGTPVWVSPYYDPQVESLDIPIQTGLEGTVTIVTLVMESPVAFGIGHINLSGVYPLIAAASQQRLLCDVFASSAYGQIRRTHNSSNGQSRDNVSYNAGEFDAVPATGFQCLCAAMAADLGIISVPDAQALVTSSVAALVATPKHASGIMPHWLLYGARHPGSEWSTVDTSLALFSAIVGAKMLGMSSAVDDVSAILDGIDGASLRNPNGTITHGFDGAGNRLPYAWDSYGGELVMADMMCSWSDPAGHPRNPSNTYKYPPVFRGRGFIQEIAGLIFPAFGRYQIFDQFKVSWYDQRLILQNQQQARRSGDLYGISSGEIIDYSFKETPYYFSPDLDPLADTFGSTGPWVLPHYMAMVSDIDPAGDQRARQLADFGAFNVWTGPAESFSMDPSYQYVHRLEISLNAFFNFAGWYYAVKRSRGQCLTKETDPVLNACRSIPKLAAALKLWIPCLDPIVTPDIPLLAVGQGFGPAGLAFSYSTVMAIGDVTDPFQGYITLNQPVTMTPSSSGTSGCTLASGPTLDLGNTRAVWEFTKDTDYATIIVEGSPPAGVPWAVSAGGEYPEASTIYTVRLYMVGTLDPMDPTINEGDPLTLQPYPYPTFSESELGTVEWYKDGSPTGVTTWTLYIGSTVPSDSGVYELYVNGVSWSSLGFGSATTVTVTPAVDPLMAEAFWPSSGGSTSATVLGSSVSALIDGESAFPSDVSHGSNSSWTVALIVRAPGPDTLGGSGFTVDSSSNSVSATLADSANPGVVHFQTGTPNSVDISGDTSWHAYIITYDSGTNELKGYNNGSSFSPDFSITSENDMSGDLNLSMGGGLSGTFIVWDRALSPSEVATVTSGIVFPP